MIKNKNRGGRTKLAITQVLSRFLSIVFAAILCAGITPLTARADKNYSYTRTERRNGGIPHSEDITITADPNETVYIELTVNGANGFYFPNVIIYDAIDPSNRETYPADDTGYATHTFTITCLGNPSDFYRYSIIMYDMNATTFSIDYVNVRINWTDPNSDQAPAPGVQEPPHVHSYKWETVKEPTEKEEGLEVYKCTGCGDIKEKNVLSAQTVFEAENIKKIEKCPLNGTVYIETIPWNSFGRGVRDAMIKRPDVTIKASFLSEGHKGIPLKVTLPAGSASLFDQNGYLGLCNAGTTLGYDQ